MNIDYLIQNLAELREKYGPQLEVVVKVAELLLDVQALTVEKLEYPEGASVVALEVPSQLTLAIRQE